MGCVPAVARPALIDPAAALAAGRDAGLSAVGVATAEPFDDARRVLEERRDAGLHGGMAFTYRNPGRSTDPASALPDAAALVVGALAYRRPDRPAPDAASGRVARYAWDDHYATLRHALAAVADVLVDEGWRAVVVADQNTMVDRAAAHRAGLGWYGKSSNLLLPGQGSWFVLGSVVTDAPLAPSGPPVADGCGTCDRCIQACPTGAIVAPGVVDARRCLAWLVQAEGPFPAEHRVALGDRIYGCDDCQEVCPPNRVADRRDDDRAPSAAASRDDWVDLVGLVVGDDADLLERYGRWYVPRRDARYLRRNALIALGNTAPAHDPRVERALRAALGAEDPLVRAHAVWAACRLGRSDLVAPLAADDAPEVQAELVADVEVRAAL